MTSLGGSAMIQKAMTWLFAAQGFGRRLFLHRRQGLL